MAKKLKKGRKRKKQNNILVISTFAAMMTLALFFGMAFSKITKQITLKEEEYLELEEEKKEKQKELNKKTMEVNYYQSDENIEKIAREELGLVYPQEVVFIQSND